MQRNFADIRYELPRRMSEPLATADLTDEPDLSGREFGGYRLLRRLGRGAMAEVYLGEQMSLGRQVAVKLLRSSLAKDDSYIRRFRFEAQAAASLVHSTIVQIYEVGCVEGHHFIAQEYVQGLNLREYLSRRGPPDVKLAVSVMRQVAAALCKAAERGIIHRDIKPENIMLAASGEVKVADFGLARAAREDVALNLTQIGYTMGTPLYMSPEQVEGRGVDHRSDIYSFGVTCFHMLVGEAPFRGETALAVAVQHLKSSPERLENLRPDLPPALCRIVHKMLAKSPAERFQSARELLRELRALPIEGGEGDVDLDLAVSPETESLLLARTAATQRLAVVMQSTSRLGGARQWLAWTIGGAAAAFALSAGLAWALRPAPLVDQRLEAAGVPKRDDVAAQYIYAASLADSEAAWQSVIDYFPSEKYYTYRAKQQLARLYLQEDDFARALALFDEFAAMDQVEEQFRAFGLAGQAIVALARRQAEPAAESLARLYPLRDKLDFNMRLMVTQAVDRQRQALGEKLPKMWDKWLANPPATDDSLDRRDAADFRPGG